MELHVWSTTAFNIRIVAQRSWLGFEAELFALSLRRTNSGFGGKLFVATPVASDLWPQDPCLPAGPLRDLLNQQDVELVEFESRDFG